MKTTIYICTHKDFTPIVSGDSYQVINSKDLKPYMGLDDRFWSELLHFINVADNDQTSDAIGFCHYRRYFSFLDNIPSEFEVIAAKPLQFGCSVRSQYAHCHNIKDLDLVEEIVRKKYPSYVEAMETFLDGNTFFPYNMFVMKRKDFKAYIKFIKTVMGEYLRIVGTDINKRIEENRNDYLKGYYPNNTVEYQYRIGGYICERLTNIFIHNRFNKISTFDVIITENKY